MIRDCDTCGGRYDAKRATSRYCSSRCRQRAHVAPKAEVAAPAPLPPLTTVTLDGVYGATMRELVAAERVDTAAGQAALLLARTLDAPGKDTGSSIAALVREHRATLAAAVEGAQTAADPLDEIARRRMQRRGA